jgi:hypothetical protein
MSIHTGRKILVALGNILEGEVKTKARGIHHYYRKLIQDLIDVYESQCTVLKEFIEAITKKSLKYILPTVDLPIGVTLPKKSYLSKESLFDYIESPDEPEPVKERISIDINFDDVFDGKLRLVNREPVISEISEIRNVVSSITKTEIYPDSSNNDVKIVDRKHDDVKIIDRKHNDVKIVDRKYNDVKIVERKSNDVKIVDRKSKDEKIVDHKPNALKKADPNDENKIIYRKADVNNFVVKSRPEFKPATNHKFASKDRKPFRQKQSNG